MGKLERIVKAILNGIRRRVLQWMEPFVMEVGEVSFSSLMLILTL